jgi:hypothetical protein
MKNDTSDERRKVAETFLKKARHHQRMADFFFAVARQHEEGCGDQQQPFASAQAPASDAAPMTIPLKGGMVAIVDQEDYGYLSLLPWSAHDAWGSGKIYPKCDTKRGGVKIKKFMHTMIMNPPKGMMVDHIDGNPMNNRRSNLRVCTKGQNLLNKGMTGLNKSGVKGVSIHRASGKWEAKCSRGRERFVIGRFDTKEEAAAAYELGAKQLHGEFASPLAR